MHEAGAAYLASWSSFYVMTGSAAASLTGLMFVVITLVVRSERVKEAEAGTATFSTPTVVHFASALLISAFTAAPWSSLWPLAVLAGLVGVVNMVYALRTMYRARRMTEYTVDLDDLMWYSILPLVVYLTIFVAAIVMLVAPAPALFALAGGVVGLIFIGIRNAWDVVTYIAIGRPRDE